MKVADKERGEEKQQDRNRPRGYRHSHPTSTFKQCRAKREEDMELDERLEENMELKESMEEKLKMEEEMMKKRWLLFRLLFKAADES